MPEVATSADERLLLDMVKRAMTLIDDQGLAPTAALEKVARDHKLAPGQIATIGNALNTGRQLSQWRSETNILDKLASFPLADPEQVVAALYNSKPEKQAAVSAEYGFSPDWLASSTEKSAHEQLLPVSAPKHEPTPERKLTVAYGEVRRAKLAADELSRRASAEEDAVRLHMFRLVDYFKTAHDRYPFEVVEFLANTSYGEPAKLLMDTVYTQARLHEKRASDKPSVCLRPIELRAAPFTHLTCCVKAAQDCHSLRQQAAAAREKAAQVEQEAYRPFAAAGEGRPASSPAPTTSSLILDKAAGVLGSLSTPAMGAGAFLGTIVSRNMGSTPPTKDDLVENAWMDLEDPNHANELRKIRAHTMLTQLMTDPDEPIAGHDPDKVLKAYNEISANYPRVADNVMTLKPLLRRQLEGRHEPFEAAEMTNIEKGLRDTKQPTPDTSLLGDTPDKVLA